MPLLGKWENEDAAIRRGMHQMPAEITCGIFIHSKMSLGQLSAFDLMSMYRLTLSCSTVCYNERLSGLFLKWGIKAMETF